METTSAQLGRFARGTGTRTGSTALLFNQNNRSRQTLPGKPGAQREVMALAAGADGRSRHAKAVIFVSLNNSCDRSTKQEDLPQAARSPEQSAEAEAVYEFSGLLQCLILAEF